MRAFLKNATNGVLGRAGLRIINRGWGPRGYLASFWTARASGFVPEMIVDVGAARGEWSEEACLVFPDARYLMIDPLPQNRLALEAVAAKIGNAYVYTAALGAQTSRRAINTHGDQSSFLKSQDFVGGVCEVDVRTCDEIFAREPLKGTLGRLIIKIDVQGYEMDVLRGAERALESTEMLLIEVSIQRIYQDNPLAHEVIAYLGARGFCIYDIASYVQRPHDRALTQVDIVFVRESSPLMSYVGWR